MTTFKAVCLIASLIALSVTCEARHHRHRSVSVSTSYARVPVAVSVPISSVRTVKTTRVRSTGCPLGGCR